MGVFQVAAAVATALACDSECMPVVGARLGFARCQGRRAGAADVTRSHEVFPGPAGAGHCGRHHMIRVIVTALLRPGRGALPGPSSAGPLSSFSSSNESGTTLARRAQAHRAPARGPGSEAQAAAARPTGTGSTAARPAGGLPCRAVLTVSLPVTVSHGDLPVSGRARSLASAH
jgi:hypothetical protein